MKGLKHAALAAHNLDRAKNFYFKLGFKPYHCHDKDWLMLRFGETSLSLVKVPEDQQIKASHSKGVHPAHLGFLADSRTEVEEKWKLLSGLEGIEISPVKEHRDLSFGFYFRDTEGNNLEFIHIPTRPIFQAPPEKELIVILCVGQQDSEQLSFSRWLIETLQGEDPRRKWEMAMTEVFDEKIPTVIHGMLNQDSYKTLKIIPSLFSGDFSQENTQVLVNEIQKNFPDLKIQMSKAFIQNSFMKNSLLDLYLIAAEELSL